MKFDTEMERELVRLMTDYHNDLGGLTLRLKVELNNLLSDYILEVADLRENDIAGLNDLTEQLYGDISVVLAPLLNEYLNMAEKAHREAVKAIVGQNYSVEELLSVGMTDSKGSIEQAKQTTYNIIAALTSEISSIVARGLTNKDGLTAKDIRDLADKKDSLLYQVRRHFEAFLSLMINEAVLQASPLIGATMWYWQTHPELTRSGTCPTCKMHAQGGANGDGMYTSIDLPMIPVHPHCVCVLIPVIFKSSRQGHSEDFQK